MTSNPSINGGSSSCSESSPAPIVWSEAFDRDAVTTAFTVLPGQPLYLREAGFPIDAGIFQSTEIRKLISTAVDRKIKATRALDVDSRAGIRAQMRRAAQELCRECPELVASVESILQKDFLKFGQAETLVHFNFQNLTVSPDDLRGINALNLHVDSFLKKDGPYPFDMLAETWSIPMGRIYLVRLADPDNLPDDDHDTRTVFVDVKNGIAADGTPAPLFKELAALPDIEGNYRHNPEGPPADMIKAHAGMVEKLDREGKIIRAPYNHLMAYNTDRLSFHCSGTPKKPVRSAFLRIMITPRFAGITR